jgi:hypothetical protein
VVDIAHYEQSREPKMETPRLMDLIRRLRYHDPDVDAQIGDDGTARIVWRHDDVGHPLTLLTTEQDLAAAVTAIGNGCRDELWPESSVEEAGLNLLLVHVDEVVATRKTSAPLRVNRAGLVWPEPRPVGDLPSGLTDLEWVAEPTAEEDN